MKIEKTSYVNYCIRFIIVSALFFLSVLVGVLFLEYRSFCAETRKLLALQAQYRFYVRDIKKKQEMMEGSSSFDVASYGGVHGDNFITVNRNPEYLKNSMIDYLKDCRLDALLLRVNIHEWQDYTGSMHVDENVATSVHTSTSGRGLRHVKRFIPKKKRATCVAGSQTSIFSWPIDTDQFWLSSLFGPRKKANGLWGRHMGIDMAAIKGTPVKAVAAGVVFESRYASGYGNMIVLHHNNRYKTRFAHLDKIFVKRGQQVSRGQLIGTVGSTGFIRKKGKDGSHLHFEVYNYNKHINPLTVLPVLT